MHKMKMTQHAKRRNKTKRGAAQKMFPKLTSGLKNTPTDRPDHTNKYAVKGNQRPLARQIPSPWQLPIFDLKTFRKTLSECVPHFFWMLDSIISRIWPQGSLQINKCSNRHSNYNAVQSFETFPSNFFLLFCYLHWRHAILQFVLMEW